MKLVYYSKKVEGYCTDINKAKKFFGGDATMARNLFSRINALERADSIKDIIVQPVFRFHNLLNKKRKDLKGSYAIDVKTRRDPWRIILILLDEGHKELLDEHIHQIANNVRIVKIVEVSKHYG